MRLLRAGGLMLLVGIAAVAVAQGRTEQKREPTLVSVTDAQLRRSCRSGMRARNRREATRADRRYIRPRFGGWRRESRRFDSGR